MMNTHSPEQTGDHPCNRDSVTPITITRTPKPHHSHDRWPQQPLHNFMLALAACWPTEKIARTGQNHLLRMGLPIVSG